MADRKKQGSGGRISFNREHRMAKLTEEQVYQIRKEWDLGIRGNDHFPFGTLATRAESYGITAKHYSAIGRRKQWKSLPEKE